MTEQVTEKKADVWHPRYGDDGSRNIDGEVFAYGTIFTERRRRRPVTATGTPCVKSEFKDQCDINRIVARMQKTGDISALNTDRPWNALDTTALPTNYTDALLLTMKVRDNFMALSAVDRQKYNNDPQEWIADLEKQQKALREAAEAAHSEAVKDAAEEAAYKKDRRQQAKKPPEVDKINK